MFKSLLLSIFLIFTFVQNSYSKDSLVTNSYRFKDRLYRLGNYVDSPPKAVINFGSSLFSEVRVDLKEIMTMPKDQGERGSCAYFSTTALIETLIKKRQGVDVNISEEYLIFHAKGELGYSSDGEGSSSKQNLQAFMGGFLLEKDVPYQTSWFNKGLPCENFKLKDSGVPKYCYSHYSPSAELLKQKIQIKGFRRREVPSRSVEIMEKMSEFKVPLIVSLPVNHKGWDGDTGYCTHNETLRAECKANPGTCGRHSVMLYGYDKEKSLFYFKNSWGKDWGKKGYGTLSFEFIDKYSGTYANFAYIKEEVVLPRDFDETTIPEISGVISQSSVENGVVQSKITASFNNVKNRSLYFSSFLVYKKLDSPADEAVGDKNIVHVMTKKEFSKKYGSYVAGRFYRNADESGVSIFDSSNPALMEFPTNIFDMNELYDKELYLRVSAYVFDDIEGYKTMHRTYVRVSF